MTDTSKHVLRPLSLRAPMEQPRSFAHKSALALSVSALMLSPLVMAEEDETIELDTLQIEDRTIDTNPYAEPGAPYKARVSGDERHVKPLAETPQTINVVTKAQIQDSGRSDLKEILQMQPGVTIGTGENGNAFGDRYIIRGQEARSDVFVDGLRDPGMTTRESFATEQVEITKGPSSTFAGRGTAGGAVNSVTKQASTEYNFTELQGGIGTDNYHRVTVDSNQVLSDTVAVRANLLEAKEDVADRDPADRERQGAALSASFDVTEKLKVVADYYYLDAQDKPDLGTYIKPNGGRPVKDIPVYVQDEDFLESEINTATVRVSYAFSNDFRVQNATRYGTTENGYLTTGARGGAVRDATDPVAPGAETITLSTHNGWQEVEYFANHLNFFVDKKDSIGNLHQMVFSVEYSDQKVANGLYEYLAGATNCITVGRNNTPTGNYCILDGDGNEVANIGSVMNRTVGKGPRDSDWNVETVSYAFMDTIDLRDDLSVFFGIRYDDFDYRNYLTPYSRQVVDGTYELREADVLLFEYSDGYWNGHMGVVYDIATNGNVYFTWSTASEINGGESDVGGSCGYGGACGEAGGKPEKIRNLELGSKWNLLDQKLLATAAVFQITKDDVMENVGSDYETLGTVNTGKNRVEGIELSLAGNVTQQLSAVGGLTVMESEVLESYDTESVGRMLSNFAEQSAFLQLRYQLFDDVAFGGVATYRGEVFAGQPDTAAGWNTTLDQYAYRVPSYTTFDLFASYDITDKLNARLNVLNATDKDFYLAAYRSGAFTYIGDARRTMLTFTYQL
ncbi:MAG: TonB-dependent receptor [Gammaproteobacteria bacterium]